MVINRRIVSLYAIARFFNIELYIIYYIILYDIKLKITLELVLYIYRDKCLAHFNYIHILNSFPIINEYNNKIKDNFIY